MHGYPTSDAPQRQAKNRLVQALARMRGIYSDNLIQVVEWCLALDPLSRPQSVFSLQKELNGGGERQYTQPTITERMRLQLDKFSEHGKKPA
jgi:hypothetical protein